MNKFGFALTEYLIKKVYQEITAGERKKYLKNGSGIRPF